MMYSSRNSPVDPTHRTANLLYSDFGPSDNDLSLGPPSAQPLVTNNFGQRAPPSTAPTPMLAHHRNQTIHGTNAMPVMSHYYAAPHFVNTQNPSQLPGCYPTPHSNFSTAELYQQFTPTYHPIDNSFNFVGMYSEPYAVPQPPAPPAALEQPVAPMQPFNYYPCRWLSGPQCDGSAPGRNREMGEHLRAFHRFVGHERDTVQCGWENCGQVMQRMNIPRHIVSRHLLAAASCRFCGKRFSRPDVVGRHERTCDGVSPISNGTSSRA